MTFKFSHLNSFSGKVLNNNPNIAFFNPLFSIQKNKTYLPHEYAKWIRICPFVFKVKRIPYLYCDVRMDETYYNSARLTSYVTVYRICNTNTKCDGMEFITETSRHSEICADVNDARAITALVKNYLKQFITRRPEENIVSLMDQIALCIKEQYLNSNIHEELIDSISPFVSTFKKRAKYEINMNLSLVLSGKPGDGKTYAADHITKYISDLLRISHIKEEAIVFEKASKQVADFTALIDDMNVSHFSRSGHSGALCSNILSELDRPECNRLFFLTTNEEISRDNIDEAFFRPGRIQSILHIDRPNVDTKRRLVNDMFNIIKKNEEFTIDNNFKCGIDMLVSEGEFSLAELFRMKNLILSDLIIKDLLRGPAEYTRSCKAIQPTH